MAKGREGGTPGEVNWQASAPGSVFANDETVPEPVQPGEEEITDPAKFGMYGDLNDEFNSLAKEELIDPRPFRVRRALKDGNFIWVLTVIGKKYLREKNLSIAEGVNKAYAEDGGIRQLEGKREDVSAQIMEFFEPYLEQLIRHGLRVKVTAEKDRYGRKSGNYLVEFLPIRNGTVGKRQSEAAGKGSKKMQRDPEAEIFFVVNPDDLEKDLLEIQKEHLFTKLSLSPRFAGKR